MTEKLIVVLPFADYATGAEIVDQREIEAVRGSNQKHFVVSVTVNEPETAQVPETTAKAAPNNKEE